MQLRRCFLTIHFGHLDPDVYPDLPNCEEGWLMIFDTMCQRLSPKLGYESGALALEMGEKLGRIHIQGYLEHKPKRLKTIAAALGCMTSCIEIVKDAKGSWDYCSGINAHEEKFAFKRFTWGTPKLHGSLEKIVLSDLVNLIISGVELRQIMVQHPYAYCVHRDRLRKFEDDWNGRKNYEM